MWPHDAGVSLAEMIAGSCRVSWMGNQMEDPSNLPRAVSEDWTPTDGGHVDAIRAQTRARPGR